MSAYTEKLKDPRWQKKRLEVLQAHDFTCDACRLTENTLHVHHGYYRKDLMPWEYEDETLHCLCEYCHKRAQLVQKFLLHSAGQLTIDDLDLLVVVSWVLSENKYRPKGMYKCVAEVIHRLSKELRDAHFDVASGD